VSGFSEWFLVSDRRRIGLHPSNHSVVDAGVRDARAVEEVERLDTRVFTAYAHVSFSDRDGTDIERT